MQASREASLIVAEVRRDAALTSVELHTLEQSCTWCFEAHGVELVGALMARGSRCAWLLFRAADIESVRLVSRRLNIETGRMWSLAGQAVQAK